MNSSTRNEITEEEILATHISATGIPTDGILPDGNIRFAGIELDVPDAQYRAAPGLSQSALKEFARSPAHYRKYLQREPKQTPAQRLGELVHRAVFQPAAYESSTLAVPKLSRTTRAGKEARAELEAAHPGREFVEPEEAQLIAGIVASLSAHPGVASALSSGLAEVSAWGSDAVTGVWCKGRFDWLRLSEGQIFDLKTTDDAAPTAFARAAVNFKYHGQVAHYLELGRAVGLTAPTFTWIVVEKSPPYAVALYQLDPTDLRRAADERHALLERFALCSARDDWPAYPDEVQELSLPPYAWTR